MLRIQTRSTRRYTSRTRGRSLLPGRRRRRRSGVNKFVWIHFTSRILAEMQRQNHVIGKLILPSEVMQTRPAEVMSSRCRWTPPSYASAHTLPATTGITVTLGGAQCRDHLPLRLLYARNSFSLPDRPTISELFRLNKDAHGDASAPCNRVRSA